MAARASLVPDVIITSDAVRARTTAEAVAEAAGYSQAINIEPSLYHAKPNDLLAVLSDVRSDARTVLVVGHNPGLEDLVRQLTGEDHDLANGGTRAYRDGDRWMERGRYRKCGIDRRHWRPRD